MKSFTPGIYWKSIRSSCNESGTNDEVKYLWIRFWEKRIRM